MPNRALFDIEADGTDRGFDGAHDQVLSCTLRNPTGPLSWMLQVFAAAGFDPSLPFAESPPRQSPGATELELVGATSGPAVFAATISSAITTTLPSAPEVSAWIIRSVVDGGVKSLPNGAVVPDPDAIHERMIVIRSASGLRKIVATERAQYHVDGIAEAWGGVVDSDFGGLAVDFAPKDFLWETAGLADDAAIIDGFEGDYASVAGTEQITIEANGGGAQVVSLAGTDVTAALIAAKINAATGFSTAGPGGTALASVLGAHLRLAASSSVSVISHGTRVDFERIGLPVESRDAAAAPTSIYQVPLSPQSGGGGLDRVDMISDAYELATGTTHLSFDATLTGDDGDGAAARMLYAVVFEFASGRGAAPFTTVLDPVFETLFDVSGTIDTAVAGYAAVVPEGSFVRQSRTPIDVQALHFGFSVDKVPAGAVSVRLLVLGMVPPAATGAEELPDQLPSFSCTVTGSTR